MKGRIELAQGDMRTFSPGRRFDLVNLSWSFIYLLTPEDQRRALTCMHDHLEDGGRLVFSVPDPKIDKPLTMRFTVGQEMQYLLELCGFSVDELYGDHQRGPYRPGGGQIWVARKAAAGRSRRS